MRIDWELMDRIDYFNRPIPYPIFFWYDNPGEYMTDYNAAVSFLMGKNLVIGELESVTMNISEIDSSYLAVHKVLNSRKINETEMVLNQIQNPIDQNETLFNLLCPSIQIKSSSILSISNIRDTKTSEPNIADSIFPPIRPDESIIMNLIKEYENGYNLLSKQN